VALADLEPLDRYALHVFNELAKTVRDAYDRYEFHMVYRAIYNFCVIDMSNFYLDIIKDRLYCGDDAGRKSAQTALYTILSGMTRLIAPILAFTSEEIWAAMTHASSEEADSVLYNDMPAYEAALVLDEAEQARWTALIAFRDTVNKALENARANGGVKKNQDAEITVTLPAAEAAALEGLDLATLCIVSKVNVTVTDAPDAVTTVVVAESQDPKCVRCWNHNARVGENAQHPELCPRCAAVVSAMDLDI
jgi:isoleucyl-tRNA synthetase